MPLIVGVNDEEKFEQFTEAQRKFIPSFGGMGLMCMTTGVGHIHKRGEEITYGVSIEEAYRRFALYDRISSKNEEDEGYWAFTLEFVEQLAEADFTCNVSTKSNEECDHALAWVSLHRVNDNLRHETEDKKIFSYNSITENSYHKIQELKKTAKYVADTWMEKDEYDSETWDEWMKGHIYELIDCLSLYDRYEWNEETEKYSLKVEGDLTNPL